MMVITRTKQRFKTVPNSKRNPSVVSVLSASDYLLLKQLLWCKCALYKKFPAINQPLCRTYYKFNRVIQQNEDFKRARKSLWKIEYKTIKNLIFYLNYITKQSHYNLIYHCCYRRHSSRGTHYILKLFPQKTHVIFPKYKGHNNTSHH